MPPLDQPVSSMKWDQLGERLWVSLRSVENSMNGPKLQQWSAGNGGAMLSTVLNLKADITNMHVMSRDVVLAEVRNSPVYTVDIT